MKYEIFIYNSDDELLGRVTDAQDITVQTELNRAGTASFSLMKGSPFANKTNINGANYVMIYRDDVAIFGGKMANVNLSAQENDTLNIVCLGWAYWLNNYEVTHKYTAPTIIGVLAWALITEVQARTNGDLGISFGADTTVGEVYFREYQRAKVYDALIDLTETYGLMDFEITPSRVFNAYVSKGSDKTNSIVLDYSEGFKNVKSVSISESFEEIKNVITVVGDGNHSVTDSDAVSMGLYGRREDTITESDWGDSNTLTSKVNEFLKTKASENFDCRVELIEGRFPGIDDVAMGDTVSVNYASTLYAFNENMRIYSITYKYSNSMESIELGLNKVI